MNILAQRSKFLAGCLTATGFILLTAGILIAVFISPYAVTLAAIGGACFLIGLYLLLSPTIAVAEKEGYITGYAVVHIITGNYGGISAIVANKEFPMKNGKYQDVDREWLDGRIQTLITEYETAEKENGGQAS